MTWEEFYDFANMEEFGAEQSRADVALYEIDGDTSDIKPLFATGFTGQEKEWSQTLYYQAQYDPMDCPMSWLDDRLPERVMKDCFKHIDRAMRGRFEDTLRMEGLDFFRMASYKGPKMTGDSDHRGVFTVYFELNIKWLAEWA